MGGYRKRYRYGGNVRRSKRRRGGVNSALSIASKALAVAKQVKSLINVEFKDFTDDSAYSEYDILVGGEMRYVNSIPTGDGPNEKNGWSIKAKNLTFRGVVKWNSDGDPIQGVRFMCVIDWNQDGSNFPTVGGTPDGILTGSEPTALRELDNTDRFQVLWDKTLYLNEERQVSLINVSKKLDHRVEFTGATHLNSSAGGGTMYFLWLSDDTTLENEPTVTGQWRFRYIDN